MSTVSIEKLRHTNNNMTELPVIVDRLKEQLEWLEALPDRLIEDSQLIDKISLIKQQHPWTARAEQLKKEYLANRQLEQENKMINEQLSNMSKDLKHKTENLYQNSIKIDLLETRMRNLSQQVSVMLYFYSYYIISS